MSLCRCGAHAPNFPEPLADQIRELVSAQSGLTQAVATALENGKPPAPIPHRIRKEDGALRVLQLAQCLIGQPAHAENQVKRLPIYYGNQFLGRFCIPAATPARL